MPTLMNNPRYRRSRQVGPALLASGAALTLVMLAGCSGGGGSATATTVSGTTGTAPPSTAASAVKPLTLEQGRKLVEQIRKNPNRLNKLTPAEVQFLATMVVAEQDRKKAEH